MAKIGSYSAGTGPLWAERSRMEFREDGETPPYWKLHPKVFNPWLIKCQEYIVLSDDLQTELKDEYVDLRDREKLTRFWIDPEELDSE